MIRNNFIKAFCFGLALCLLLTGFNICFAEETAEPDWDVKEEQGGFKADTCTRKYSGGS